MNVGGGTVRCTICECAVSLATDNASLTTGGVSLTTVACLIGYRYEFATVPRLLNGWLVYGVIRLATGHSTKNIVESV